MGKHQAIFKIKADEATKAIAIVMELPDNPDPTKRVLEWLGTLAEFRAEIDRIPKVFEPFVAPGAAQDMRADLQRVLVEIEKAFAKGETGG